ncbi:hypothetical protein D3C84_593830 [compost metagenome]
MKTILTTDTFDSWFAGLRDKRAAMRIQARIDRAEDGNFGDCEPVGKVFRKCVFTTGQAIGCTSSSEAWRS